MKNFYSILIILFSFFISTNIQAQCLFSSIVEASKEAEAERLKEAPIIAPKLIIESKEKSDLGAYLVDQLTIQSEAGTKKNARKIRSAIKKIQKDLNKLNAAISGWEIQDYSDKLDKLAKNFDKHIKKYKQILIPEQERMAAAVKAERERVAAAAKAERERVAAIAKAERERVAAIKRAKEAKLKAYIARCEPSTASNDPFAAFNTVGEKRSDLVVQVGSSEMKLQATKTGCMWLGNASRADIKPSLIIEDNYQQNPNQNSQYVLDVAKVSNGRNAIQSASGDLTFNMGAAGRFILDFEKYNCAFTRENGNSQTLNCNRGPIDFNDIANIATTECNTVNLLREQNMTAFGEKFGMKGAARATECGFM